MARKVEHVNLKGGSILGYRWGLVLREYLSIRRWYQHRGQKLGFLNYARLPSGLRQTTMVFSFLCLIKTTTSKTVLLDEKKRIGEKALSVLCPLAAAAGPESADIYSPWQGRWAAPVSVPATRVSQKCGWSVKGLSEETLIPACGETKH